MNEYITEAHSLDASEGMVQAPPAPPNSLLSSYRAAVEELVLEASRYPRSSELTVIEELVAGCLGQPEIAAVLSEHAPFTVETTKEALRRIRIQMTPPGGASDLIIKAYMSEDFREGIEAFFAKRPARWKGR